MMTRFRLLLAMAQEVHAEDVEARVARMTGEERDPYLDVRLILQSLEYPRERAEGFVKFLRECALESAYREIERRYPDRPRSVPALKYWCPDCSGSGVAPYGHCKRCKGTGWVDTWDEVA